MLKVSEKFYGSQLRDASEVLREDAAEKFQSLVDKTCEGSEFTGWFQWPENHGRTLVEQVEAFIEGYTPPYDTVVVIGIGGSYLGAKCVYDALSHRFGLDEESGNRKKIVFAGQNLSESELVELMEYLERREPVVNVISKSGTTTEPGVAFRVIREYMETRYGSAATDRIIATTDANKGALRELAGEKSYKMFEVPDDVGGRFSVLTAVGVVPLALAGFQVGELMRGAGEFFSDVMEKNSESKYRAYDNMVKYASGRIAAWNAGARIELLAYAEPRLEGVVEWWKQLFGESEGKGGKGLFPAGLKYTTDLHSLGQYVQEGVRNQIETFLFVESPLSKGSAGVEKRLRVPRGGAADGLAYLEGRHISDINHAAMIATEIAHSDADVPCLELHLKDVSEASLGYLFAFFETSCAVSALMLGVNPFDQPGVEAYKKNLFAIMGRPGFEELSESLAARL